MTIDEAIRKIFEKSDIRYNNYIISKERLLRTYASFVSGTIDIEEHNIGLVLHPGTICFDVISVVIAAIVNFIYNETSSIELVESISQGEFVLYNGERYVFSGFKSGKEISIIPYNIRYAELTQERKVQGYTTISTTYVSEESWGKIIPYNGNSKRTDGRGIRKKSTIREDFFRYVLDYPEDKIPGIIDTSSLIVMPRSKADDLINEITISFNNKKAKLLELVTASYYSEEGEYSYSGNIGKNEPVLKFCSKLSVARRHILSRCGNRNIGIMIMGQETLERSKSELPELLERKSIKYIYLSTTLDSGYGIDLLKSYSKIELFVCSKELMSEQDISGIVEENPYTIELNRRVKNIRNSEFVSYKIDSFPLGVDECLDFRRLMLMIKRDPHESAEKEEFIIQAISLMNMFKTAAFSMGTAEEVIKKECLSVDTPEEKLKSIQFLSEKLPESIRGYAGKICLYLDSVYNDFLNSNPKQIWLEEHLKNNIEKKIAIVVPKAYYISIMSSYICFPISLVRKVAFVTAGRFDEGKIYDEIIMVGDFEGKKFDAFRCNSSETIIGLLYEDEEKRFNIKKRMKNRDDNFLNSRSKIRISNIENVDDYLDKDSDMIQEVEDELNDYIEKVDAMTYIKERFDDRENKGVATTEIVAIATLEDDRKVFFSKQYKAYVFDADTGETKEVESKDLCEGDAVVFTKNDSNTKDVVDSLIQQLIKDEKLSGEMINDYRRSKEWKETLRNYMTTNGLAVNEVANQLVEIGAPVQAVTIIRWMDEDAHTVGPQKAESLMLIGKLANNDNLVNGYETYYQSCKNIRKLRIKLLSEIGRAIINKLNGKKPVPGTLFFDIYNKIDDLSEVIQIDRINVTEKIMPITIANRPINLRGNKNG